MHGSELMEFINDYLVLKNEMRWIGTFIKLGSKCLVVLNENVHDWLIPFHGFYVGFR